MSSQQGKQLVEEIISRIDIVDLISENVVLKKSGSGFTGLCPFHQEKTPSFHVNGQKQIFRCFGCGEGGNIFQYYMRFHNLNFKNALTELANRCGVEIAHSEYNREDSDKKEEIKKNIYDIYDISAKFYKWNLEHQRFGEIAREYLSKRKTSQAMIESFGLGFAQESWDSLFLFLQKKGFSSDEIKDSGLVVEKESGGFYDRFRNRIIFPIQNEKGQIIAFGGRTLDPNAPAKYINSPETSIYIKGQHLYALNFAKDKIREKSQVILVEGYLDVIACHEFGFENTVASLGTALTPDQAKKLLRYNSEKKVIVAYDADNAGQKAAEKGTSVLEEVAKGTGISIYILKVPSGKDPDDFLHTEGQESFQKLVDNVKPIIEFQIEKALSFDFSDPEGKVKAIDKCVEVLIKIENDIYKSDMIKKIANWQYGGKRLNVREEDIRKRLKISNMSNYSQPNQNNYNPNNNFNQYKSFKKFPKDKNEFDYGKKLMSQRLLAEYEKESISDQAEKGIIYFMIERRKAFEYIEKRLEHIVFQDQINENIKLKIIELFHNNQLETWQNLLNSFEESDYQKKIVEIWEGFEDIDIASDKILRDYLRQVKLSYLKTQKEELKSEIDNAMRTGHADMAKTFMTEYTLLAQELKRIEAEIYSN